jgi:hypothetical protein
MTILCERCGQCRPDGVEDAYGLAARRPLEKFVEAVDLLLHKLFRSYHWLGI